VHVNWRVLPHVWNLRSRQSFRVILRACAATGKRLGMRITHFSVMGNHVHLIVEADGTAALSRGMQGLAIRLAKGLNKLMEGRRGKVFADRYHAHPLHNPTETRNAIAYVMNNARIHAQRQGRSGPRGADEYAVGPAQLEGRDALWRRLGEWGPPVTQPSSWLLTEGWQLARA
jgi:REP element-mobilizing transposase RayT